MWPISVLILTKNEAADIGDCLRSVARCDDIHVLDSGSIDDTRAIAERMGAQVAVREFDNFAAQRNYGLHELPLRHDWVLVLDADERATPELLDEIEHFVASADEKCAATRMDRHNFWMGQCLRHAIISPMVIRLMRRSRVHYEREINEILVVNGQVAELKGHLDHFSFSRGLDHWVSKHNLYSSMEAALIVDERVGTPELSKAFFASDVFERRMHQKRLFYRLPGRPIFKFFYMLLFRRAFLDGVIGMHYTLLQCFYEYLIVLKTREIRELRTPR